MKLNVSEVPEKGLTFRWDEPPESLEARLRGSDSASVVTARSPVHADVTAARIARTVAVVGRLRAEVGLQCGRCLGPAEAAFDLPAALLFVPEGPAGRRDDAGADDALAEVDLSGLPFDLPGEDLEVLDYRGGEIDLSQAVLDQVVLAIPVQPLCNAACRGLCPTCGQDLNQAACTCAAGPVDLRLAALKDLKISR